jgi:hypothetical protein
MSLTKSIAVTLFVAATSIVACSSDDNSNAPSTCDANPYLCPAGQTCWVNAKVQFKCFISGGGKEGDTCKNVPEQPSCLDGLTCLQLTPAGGVCTSYCDGAHPCPNGAACKPYQIPGGPVFKACEPPAPIQTDGGTAEAGGDAAPMDSAPPDSAPDAPSDATGQ